MSFDWLVARPIAHRGWHGGAVVENSLPAARAAVAAGYAVEFDLQRTADGEAVVFHDATLQRLTDGEGAIASLSREAVARLALKGGGSIPTFAEWLACVGGRVPLICEIKSAFDGDFRLAERALKLVADYEGPLAFKSFDPDVVAYLRAQNPPRPLGIVAEASYDDPYFDALSPAQKRDCAAFLHIGRTRPDFLSWSVADLPHPTPTLMRALGGKPVMAWTVRTPEQWRLARAYADQAVFEGSAPG